MTRSTAAPLLGLALLTLGPAAANAQRLLEMEGIELRGSARVVEYGAGTCNVSEERETAASYEQKRANHGRPVDLWQLDFSVYNGSGRALDHLIANYRIVAENPPCTNWSWPEAGRYPGPIEWGDLAGFIQRSGGGDPTQPGETLTDTKYIFVFHEHQPRFDSWSVDYNFAAGAPGAATPGTDAPPAPGSATPPAAADARPGAPPRTLPASLTSADTCLGQDAGAACWMELANRPGCYLWEPRLIAAETATWSGACSDGLAHGPGTDSRRWDEGENASEGSYARGLRNGNWVLNLSGNGDAVLEGAYIDGKRDGWWIRRDGGEAWAVASFVDGEETYRILRRPRSGDDGYTYALFERAPGSGYSRGIICSYWQRDETPAAVDWIFFFEDEDEGSDNWNTCLERRRLFECVVRGDC